MDKLAGLIIDSLAVAREGKIFAGDIAPGELPRLLDVLGGPEGRLAWQVQGARGREGKLFLDIAVRGEVRLVCQRCLEALPLTVEAASRLLLIAPGSPWPDEDLADDTVDAIEALARQPLIALVEDELLLALPLAPRHAACEPPASGGDRDGAAGSQAAFQKLAALRRKRSH